MINVAIDVLKSTPRMKKASNNKTRHKLVAVAYDKKGRILSIRGNRYDKTHPLQHYFAKKVGRPEAIYLHAEIAAIIAARSSEIHKLLVVRLNRDGDPVNAKPCKICQEAIIAYGIKEVEYSTEDGIKKL